MTRVGMLLLVGIYTERTSGKVWWAFVILTSKLHSMYPFVMLPKSSKWIHSPLLLAYVHRLTRKHTPPLPLSLTRQNTHTRARASRMQFAGAIRDKLLHLMKSVRWPFYRLHGRRDIQEIKIPVCTTNQNDL